MPTTTTITTTKDYYVKNETDDDNTKNTTNTTTNNNINDDDDDDDDMIVNYDECISSMTRIMMTIQLFELIVGVVVVVSVSSCGDDCTGSRTTTTMMILLLLLMMMMTFVYMMRYYIRPLIEKKKPFVRLSMPPYSNIISGHVEYMNNIKYDFRTNLEILSIDYANVYGRTGYWFFQQPCISVTHYEDVRNVLKNEYIRQKLPMIDKHLEMLLGQNCVLFLKGKEWRYHRNAILKSLSSTLALQNSKQCMNTVSKTLVMALHNKIDINKKSDNNNCETDTSTTDSTTTTATTAVVDIEQIMKMYTMDVFGLAAMSTDIGCCTNVDKKGKLAEYFDYVMNDVFTRLTKIYLPHMNYYSIPTQNNIEFMKRQNYIRQFVRTVVEQHVIERNCNNNNASNNHHNNNRKKHNKRKDLLDHILDADDLVQQRQQQQQQKSSRNNNDNDNDDDNTNGRCSQQKLHVDADIGQVDNQMLNDIIMSLLFAGYDTTSISLSYTLYLLSQHPDIEQRCYQEICYYDNKKKKMSGENNTVSHDNDDIDIDYDNDENDIDDIIIDPDEFVYIKAVWKESLRLYPPAYQTTRKLQKDIKLQRKKIKRKTNININNDPTQTANTNNNNNKKINNKTQQEENETSCTSSTTTSTTNGHHHVNKNNNNNNNTEDNTDIDTFIIPAGTWVLIPIWTIGRLEYNFPKPNEFRPDRWVRFCYKTNKWIERTNNNNKDYNDSNDNNDDDDDRNNNNDNNTDKNENTIPMGNMDAFLPFSAGGRSCPGYKFAMYESIIILIHLIREFQFQFHPTTNEKNTTTTTTTTDYNTTTTTTSVEVQPDIQGIVQHPKNGIPMLISRR